MAQESHAQGYPVKDLVLQQQQLHIVLLLTWSPLLLNQQKWMKMNMSFFWSIPKEHSKA